MYADAVGMSVSWVKDWKRVFHKADPNDEIGRPRQRRTPLEDYEPDVIEAVLDIRDHPPQYCPRPPGPTVIQYELAQHFADTDKRFPPFNQHDLDHTGSASAHYTSVTTLAGTR